ncbi:MAG TPA: DNA methyltransferase, partial [Actinomycetota bacterium]|nr:DNA methyltransferase [Actinomycetota bacterium]
MSCDRCRCDEGYDLPPLEVRWHEIPVPPADDLVDRDGQGRMLRDATLGVSQAAREKRDTLDLRVAAAKAIVDASPEDHFILWHDLEAERHAIKKAIPEAVEVYGNLDLDVREDRIIGFSDGDFRLLATKPELSGSGCNFQRHCHREIFVGVGFKFNDFIQSVHRVQRFLQTEPVVIDIIYAESEREVVKTLRRKWAQHAELTARMSEVIREHGLDQLSVTQALGRSLGVERQEASGAGWLLACNDCVPETMGMESDSVDGIGTSIPFGNHYEYVAAYEDFGHTDDPEHFWRQMDFLTPELLRVLRPGRVMWWHVKDRIVFGNVTGNGFSTVAPFHAEAIMHARKHGFEYMGMVTVVTDVVRENNQSYRLGWTEQCKDGSKMGVGSPEYVLIFRKPQTDQTKGYADVPVVKDKTRYSRSRWQVDAHAFWRSNGNRALTPKDMEGLSTAQRMKMFEQWSLGEVYDYEAHYKLGEALDDMGQLPAHFMALAPASPHPDVWTDVARMRTLNTEQSQRRQTLHVCPLQFDIVDRLIERYSNPGELI